MSYLNATFIYGLIISKYVDKSPLMLFAPRSFYPTLSFSSFKLTNFLNTALFIQTQSSMQVKKSYFYKFSKTPIINSRPDINDFSRHCDDRINHLSEITESTFQICSTDNFANTDTVNSSGGALFFDNNTNNIIKIKQCNFVYCHAGINGGAIYVGYSRTLDIEFTYFQDCDTGFMHYQSGVNASKGGAIYSCCIYLNITSCNFTRCNVGSDYSQKYGGAIFVARCASVETQGLKIVLSSFEQCGTTNVYNGGAIYVNCSSIPSPSFDVNISFTNFSNCEYANGSVIEVLGDSRFIFFNHTGFYRDRVLPIPNPVNYSILSFANTNTSRPTELYLYNVSLFENNDIPTNFIIKASNGSIANSRDNFGSIYLSRCDASYAFFNEKKINLLLYVNLFCKEEYSYPFIVALNDDQVYKPFATPLSTPSPSRSVSPSQSSFLVTSNADAVTSEPVLQTDSPTGDGNANGGAGDSSTADSKSGGLSTAAIVLIVIAVIFVLVTIIMISVLCVRNGSCGFSNKDKIQDVRSVENDDAIRRFTYF